MYKKKREATKKKKENPKEIWHIDCGVGGIKSLLWLNLIRFCQWTGVNDHQAYKEAGKGKQNAHMK